jgi:hypothetical protein
MQLEEENKGVLHPENEKSSVPAETQDANTVLATRACIALLSDKDIERNRKGFELLNALTQPSTSWINPSEARAIANGLIYGGKPKSAESLLRYRFANFFCDFQERREEDDCEEDYDDDDETPWGLHTGALHLEAIKILINSLQLIIDEADNSSDTIVDFSCQYWARVFDTLVRDIQESFEDFELTRLSAKCIRVLHGLNPPVVADSVAVPSCSKRNESEQLLEDCGFIMTLDKTKCLEGASLELSWKLYPLTFAS